MDQGQVSGAPEHEVGEGDEVEAGQRLGQAFVVAGEPAASGHPGEGTLDSPLYNVAGLSFEWSAVLAREHLADPRWNAAPSTRSGQHPPLGGETGTDGGAHGSIDAASCRGGARLLREHEARPALPGRDIRPHRADPAQAGPGRGRGRAGAHRPADHHREG